MFTNTVSVRVRYAETDQMGYVYYGNYATYFEVARVESLRTLGVSYRELEANGVMLPVLEYKSKYIRPAKYDDMLHIKVTIRQLPVVRIVFEYEVVNDLNELITVADTTLVFINADTKKPCAAPPYFIDKIKKYF
ncbi:MAG: thioesterase family protein [Cytophagales bacterium]|nr:thioesterase family protein [Cytophagales bacterium]